MKPLYVRSLVPQALLYTLNQNRWLSFPWRSPHSTNLRGQGTNLRGQGANLRQGTNLRGQGTNLRGQGTNLHGQGANLRGQGTNLHGQGANLRGQGTNLRGQGTNLRAQGTNRRGQGSKFYGFGACPRILCLFQVCGEGPREWSQIKVYGLSELYIFLVLWDSLGGRLKSCLSESSFGSVSLGFRRHGTAPSRKHASMWPASPHPTPSPNPESKALQS